MSYATKSEIESVFGKSNVASWSNLDNEMSGADDTRIASAISYADSIINARLRGGRYALPLVNSQGTVPGLVKDWAAKLAGVWLYECRGLFDDD
ncbi:MAG TPA: DUF1320 family protein, partial [Phycisphaerae bacterium]|nr:DUF1320 family protein [Phycisphaerae bacterium]